MRLIGFCGEIGSGKTTAADCLVEHRGYTKLSFATPLKQGVQQFFDFSDKQMTDRALKEAADARWKLSPRRAMQFIGTEYARHTIRPDFWVVHLCSRMRRILANDSDARLVIDDVRFANEVDTIINEFEGTVCDIIRQDNPFSVHAKVDHPSENAQFDRTHVRTLYNSSTLSAFEAVVLSAEQGGCLS